MSREHPDVFLCSNAGCGGERKVGRGFCAQCLSSDPAVVKPSHYQSETGLECFDAQIAALGVTGFVAYAKGCALKYIWRAGEKGPEAQDLRKAAEYLNKAADVLMGGARKF